MDRFVARANVQHFERLLETATDPVEKDRLRKLLAEERQKLKIAEDRHKQGQIDRNDAAQHDTNGHSR